MSRFYKSIKLYYERDFYKVEDLQVFVRAGLITQEEMNKIVNSTKQKK